MYSDLFLQFHELLLLKSPSSLSMSLKSDPGVLEDMSIPETTKIAFNKFRNVYKEYDLHV